MIEALSSNRTAIILVTALLLTLVMTTFGCDSTEEKGVEDIMDTMKKVPKDCGSFVYMDLDAMRTDADLEDEYVRLKEGLTGWADFFGGFDEVDSFTIAGRDFGDFSVLFSGDFNLDESREKLEEPGWDKGEYKGIEVWGEESGAALVSNKLVIIGYVKVCIDAMMNSDTSLYGDKNFRDIVGRLPGGVYYNFQEDGLRIQEFYSSYDGLLVSGYSMFKKDKKSMTITSVCKFEDVDFASKAIDSIKQDLENYAYEEYRNIKVEQDSEFIKIITDIDIKGFLFGE